MRNARERESERMRIKHENVILMIIKLCMIYVSRNKAIDEKKRK